LVVQSIDLDYNPIDPEGKRTPPPSHLLGKRDDRFNAFHDFGIPPNRESEIAQLGQGSADGGRQPWSRPDAIAVEAKFARGGQAAVLLAQATCRRIARVGEHLVASRQQVTIQALEDVPMHHDFASNLEGLDHQAALDGIRLVCK
jgi:hypothetical protein